LFSGEVILMQAIILAAGVGSRMRPLTLEKPKCLIDIAGKSFIDRQIEVFRNCSIDKITVVTGYKSNLIREHLKNTVNYAYNPFYETTNSIVSLWLATLNIDDDILIVNSDVIFDDELIKKMINCDKDINIAVSKLWSDERGYKAQIINDKVVDMSMDIEKGKIGGEYAGLIYVKKDVMNNLKLQSEKMLSEKQFNVWFEDMVVEMIKSGNIANAIYVDNEKWYEIDSVPELEFARKKFRE